MKSKKLTTFELYWYILGTAIGSGLFVLLPIAIGYTGRSVVLTLIVAGIMRLVTDLYSVTMASMFPLKGGQYSQVSYLIPPLFSGVYGLVWLISTLTLAAYATSAISYTAALIPGIARYSKIIAIVIVTFFFGLNYFGTKFGAKFQRAMTITLLLALAAFIIWGLPKVQFGSYTENNFFLGGISGFSGALAMCAWATDGILSTGASLASEMERPTRQVPKAMVGGVIIVITIYVLITFVAAGTLPIEQVAFQDLTVVAEHIFPRSIYVVFVLAGAVMALMTSLMGGVTVMRYPFEQMTEEGWLPAIFKRRTANGWPVVTMVVMYIMVMIPVIFGISFDAIVSYCTFPGTFIVFYVDLKCMTLPKKYPELWKSPLWEKSPCRFTILCALPVLLETFIWPIAIAPK